MVMRTVIENVVALGVSPKDKMRKKDVESKDNITSIRMKNSKDATSFIPSL